MSNKPTTDAAEQQRFRRFIREHSSVASTLRFMPVFICGVGGKRVPTLDATLADLRAYQQLLDSRIRRHTRKR